MQATAFPIAFFAASFHALAVRHQATVVEFIELVSTFNRLVIIQVVGYAGSAQIAVLVCVCVCDRRITTLTRPRDTRS